MSGEGDVVDWNGVVERVVGGWYRDAEITGAVWDGVEADVETAGDVMCVCERNCEL